MVDLSWCRALFPALQRRQGDAPLVFLDGPGGTQVPYPVMEAVTAYWRQSNANTHGPFVTSQETDRLVAQTRERAAAFLGVPDPRAIAFGPNMTTLAFQISHALAAHIQPHDTVVVTALDHDANVAPWLRYQAKGARVKTVPVLPDGRLDLEVLFRWIEEGPRLVALGWASNAVGTVQDLAPIVAAAHRHGTWVVVDAVHWAPHGPIDVAALDPDFLLCSAYKFFGPHVGIAYVARRHWAHLQPDQVRPKVADGAAVLETGTLNHAALAGLCAAIGFLARLGGSETVTRKALVAAMEAIYAYEHALFVALYEGLAAIPDLRLWGPPPDAAPRRAPTVAFTHPRLGAGEIARRLGAEGILAWAGDFYAYGLRQAWHLDQIGGLVRLGLAPYNTADEIDRTVATVRRILTA
ncbi:MAG: cysteine desulfurase-like protein [Firmicutes bacterium]|nr:cysteine desulfurase-like protein [Alicyclobacillaceae bacterium]MCL6496951.1 cysteine desulfurase-like protein [Bacillota bacterium]